MGGIALSLRYGHRTSVDLDLFYHEKFDQEPIIKSLENEFGEKFDYRDKHSQFGVFCFIDNVKVDIVKFPHMPIADVVTEGDIRMYADADIAAMKIQAILGWGKTKVFGGFARTSETLLPTADNELAQTKISEPDVSDQYSSRTHLLCRC